MKILRNIMCLSTSAFLLAACNGNSGNVKKGAAGGVPGEGQIQAFFVSAYYWYYDKPAMEFPLDPQTIIPPEFTTYNWNARNIYAWDPNQNPSYGAHDYSIKNTQFKISNNGEGDLVVTKIEIKPHDPLFGAITFDSVSYPLTIRPNESYSVTITNTECGDPFQSDAIKVSIESDAKDYPDFNSDLIIHCGY